MARAKTPRTNNPNKTNNNNVTTMPAVSELKLVPEGKRTSSPLNLEEEIRRRAYELYEQRGATSGQDHEDWLVAEREILARYNFQQSA